MLEDGETRNDVTGEYITYSRGSEYVGHPVFIILTIAHLYDHRPEACDDDNLGALCQQCHNRHDAKMRAAGKKFRKHYRHHDDLFDEGGPLLRARENRT